MPLNIFISHVYAQIYIHMLFLSMGQTWYMTWCASIPLNSRSPVKSSTMIIAKLRASCALHTRSPSSSGTAAGAYSTVGIHSAAKKRPAHPQDPVNHSRRVLSRVEKQKPIGPAGVTCKRRPTWTPCLFAAAPAAPAAHGQRPRHNSNWQARHAPDRQREQASGRRSSGCARSYTCRCHKHSSRRQASRERRPHAFWPTAFDSDAADNSASYYRAGCQSRPRGLATNEGMGTG